jgi:hypothetical protein
LLATQVACDPLPEIDYDQWLLKHVRNNWIFKIEEMSWATTVRRAESRNWYTNVVLPGKVGCPFVLAATIKLAIPYLFDYGYIRQIINVPVAYLPLLIQVSFQPTCQSPRSKSAASVKIITWLKRKCAQPADSNVHGIL